jgi:hypothetical protein
MNALNLHHLHCVNQLICNSDARDEIMNPFENNLVPTQPKRESDNVAPPIQDNPFLPIFPFLQVNTLGPESV